MPHRPVPDGVPVLSAGRHGSPRHGACLMELVSVLAGERWSDQPRCVDPPLAALARTVNDVVSDPARQRLATLAPDFIGTASVAPAVRVAVAGRVLATALRLAAGADQRFLLSVALLALRRAGAAAEGGGLPDPAGLAESSVHARAVAFVELFPCPAEEYVHLGLPAALAQAVRVIRDSTGPAADEHLVDLLRASVRGYADGVIAPRGPSPLTAPSEPGNAVPRR